MDSGEKSGRERTGPNLAESSDDEEGGRRKPNKKRPDAAYKPPKRPAPDDEHESVFDSDGAEIIESDTELADRLVSYSVIYY